MIGGESLYNRIIERHWRSKLSRLITRGQKQKALQLLDAHIENTLPLFQSSPKVLQERRTAWLLRIELLKRWGRKIEALAWVCLECDINPENKLAQLFKVQLKSELNLISDEEQKEGTISNKFVESDLEWPDVAGMQELKTILKTDVIDPIKNPKQYEQYKVTIPNGILFYGPPGCGKTFVARKLAEKIDYNFIEVTPSTTASIYVHGTQQIIKNIFDNAFDEGPSVLFFDEFEAFAPSRDDISVGHSYRSEVNEFLTQLNECHENEVLVIGATNNPRLIDQAVLRPGRMDIKIFIPPPDFEARAEVFKMYMKDRPQKRIDWLRLAEYTELFTYAEIKNIVDLAARKAANQNIKIDTDILIEFIIDNPPALTEASIEELRKAI